MKKIGPITSKNSVWDILAIKASVLIQSKEFSYGSWRETFYHRYCRLFTNTSSEGTVWKKQLLMPANTCQNYTGPFCAHTELAQHKHWVGFYSLLYDIWRILCVLLKITSINKENLTIKITENNKCLMHKKLMTNRTKGDGLDKLNGFILWMGPVLDSSHEDPPFMALTLIWLNH